MAEAYGTSRFWLLKSGIALAARSSATNGILGSEYGEAKAGG